MKTSYEPSFLISVEISKELHDQISEYAKTKGVTEEQAYQEAVRFFSAQCVHTQTKPYIMCPHTKEEQ